MKRKLLLFLPALLIILASCNKENDTSVTAVQPQGTFTGQFTRYHYNVATSVVDSSKATLQLVLSSSNYTVSGDTASLHAGSRGTFKYDNSYLGFTDGTLPTSGNYTPAQIAKIHLNGVYTYSYDGSALKFTARNDTLIYYYNFKKI